MNIDLKAAADFMATHARALDRRRFGLRNDRTNVAGVVAALDGYRNRDGGYGWGLEPDLRAPESQPGGAHHAFEVFEEIAPACATQATELCDWLSSISLPDGGLPFALPISTPSGSGLWWTAADASTSSLQITAVTVAAAHRVATSDAGVAAHPWLERATDYCLAATDRMDEPPFAYVLVYAVRLAEALHERQPDRAAASLDHLRRFVPASGNVPVSGGTEDEKLHPLDFARDPDRPARTLFTDDIIERDLERLGALQQSDGGWVVDYRKISPAGSLDWRGYATVRGVDVLCRNVGAAPA
jgi:hypothetical protein